MNPNRCADQTVRVAWLVLACAGWLMAQPAVVTPKIAAVRDVSDFVWDSGRSRIFASAASGVVMINPGTAQVEDTIVSGESPDRIALSSDGAVLYAATSSRGVIDRYQVQSRTQDLVISLGPASQGQSQTVAAMIVLPGQPQRILASG